MFFAENWQVSNREEQVKRAASKLDALSYVFLDRYASTSVKDVTEVASFFLFKTYEN